MQISNPRQLHKLLWPQVVFYDKQWEIIDSVWNNPETFVVAGNMLGKDFVAGFIALAYFMLNRPCRVITTSVKDDHLRVLWGEIGRYIQTSKYPLEYRFGGPLLIKHRDIRWMYTQDIPRNEDELGSIDIRSGETCKISYLLGLVSEKGEGMAGHHAKHTLWIADEASGIENISYTQAGTWAKRILAIGNPNPCDMNHWFRQGVKGGDLYVDYTKYQEPAPTTT